MSIILTSDNFKSTVINTSEVALVDFWASWCGPCKMMAPVIDSLSDALSGKAIVGKLNVDESADIASEYAIVSIPTLIIFKSGKEQERLVGVRSEADIMSAMEKYL